ncbi:hypothetical protein [Nonomuraea sp. LPB2021202275-12-8]|uniref:hypothetical protein n=1 Tax=Nonomuraea sp. LPB2021202275-12-8 TaxID=3120159 RepID=UPI00300C37E7
MALFRRNPERKAARTARGAEKQSQQETRQHQQEAEWAAERLHQDRLATAAEISSATLVCHRDTWSFILDRTGSLGGFNRYDTLPPGVNTVTLSGPNLVAILTRMEAISTDSLVDTDRAIATRIYRAVAEIVDGVDPAAKDGEPVPDIVLDDRMGPTPAAGE